jgi:hypothetical protein
MYVIIEKMMSVRLGTILLLLNGLCNVLCLHFVNQPSAIQ